MAGFPRLECGPHPVGVSGILPCESGGKLEDRHVLVGQVPHRPRWLVENHGDRAALRGDERYGGCVG